MQDQPQTSLERAVWWIEHVMRHGGAHLRSQSANMSFRQYYEVDLILMVLSLMMTGIILLVIILRAVLKIVSSKEKIKKT